MAKDKITRDDVNPVFVPVFERMAKAMEDMVNIMKARMGYIEPVKPTEEDPRRAETPKEQDEAK